MHGKEALEGAVEVEEVSDEVDEMRIASVDEVHEFPLEETQVVPKLCLAYA